MKEKQRDTQVTGLGGSRAPVTIELEIDFPDTYSDADRDAIWDAVRVVQVDRKLIED